MISRLSVLLKKFTEVSDFLIRWTGKIISFLLLPLIGVMFYEVVARYVFNSPTIWGYDICEQIMLILVMLGSAHTLREGAHISIDVISVRLTSRARIVLDMVFIVLLITCTAVIIWYGWIYAWYSLSMTEHSSSIWAPPVYPVKFAIPLAGALLLISVPHRLRQNIAAWRGNSEKRDKEDK